MMVRTSAQMVVAFGKLELQWTFVVVTENLLTSFAVALIESGHPLKNLAWV